MREQLAKTMPLKIKVTVRMMCCCVINLAASFLFAVRLRLVIVARQE